MAHDQEPGLVIYGLTKPKGVLLAAPVILGAAVLFSMVSGGGISSARDRGASAATAGAADRLVQDAARGDDGIVGGGGAVRLATADKPAVGGSFSASQRDEIGTIVREYLLKNPSVLQEVSEALKKAQEDAQSKQQAALLVSEKQAIFRSPHDFVFGNPKGDVTVVEYFDYNCGWCKRALPEVTQLTDSDKNVRVVMKEFPIFGEDSTFAAKAALASIKQNKYWEFHIALMKAKRVTAANTLDIAKSVGIDVEVLKKEMAKPEYDRVIAENSRLAQALGMQGTPGFIVDSRVNFGYVPVDGLRQMVAEVRKGGCKIC